MKGSICVSCLGLKRRLVQVGTWVQVLHVKRVWLVVVDGPCQRGPAAWGQLGLVRRLVQLGSGFWARCMLYQIEVAVE